MVALAGLLSLLILLSAALTLLLVIERELPRASRIGAVAGVLLLLFAAWKLVA